MSHFVGSRSVHGVLKEVLARVRGDEPGIMACALARSSAPPVLSDAADLRVLGTLTHVHCARDGGTWETPVRGASVTWTREGTLVRADAGHGLVVIALVTPHAPRALAASVRVRLAHAAGEVRAILATWPSATGNAAQ